MWGSSWDFFSLRECFPRPLLLQDCFSLSRPLHDLFVCLSVCLFFFLFFLRGSIIVYCRNSWACLHGGRVDRLTELPGEG